MQMPILRLVKKDVAISKSKALVNYALKISFDDGQRTPSLLFGTIFIISARIMTNSGNVLDRLEKEGQTR